MNETKSMFHQTISDKQKKFMLMLFCLVAATIIVNPLTWLDILIVIFLLVVVGHLLLQEKLLLAFLIVRPALDYWRDFEILNYQNISINLNAGLTIIFFVWAGYMLWRHKNTLKQAPLHILFPVCGLWLAATAIYSISPIISLIENIKFFNIILIFFLAFCLIKDKSITYKELITSFVVSAVIPVTVGLCQLLLGGGLATFEIRGRIYGTFGHPNVLAFFVMFLLAVYIYSRFITRDRIWRENKYVSLAVASILGISLVMTYTRAAWIGFFVFILVFGIFNYRRIALTLIGATVLFYIIFYPLNRWFISVANYNLQELPLIARLTSRSEEADSLAWRQALVRETKPLIDTRPWLGYGYGTFPLVWGENRSLAHLWDDSAEAHNDYLRLKLEAGSIGLTLYILVLLAILYYAFLPFYRERRPEHLFLPSLVITFIMISISDNMLHHTPVMWLMWSLFGAELARQNKISDKINFLTASSN